jgi:hypothetical protein
MKPRILLSQWTLQGLAILSLILGVSGCSSSKTMVLHAIKNPVIGKDLYVLPNGDTCMSPWYLEKILQVKIEGK